MARQSTTPVEFNRTVRTDTATIMTSGRAGQMFTVAQIPVLRGDSVQGSIGIDVELRDMPKPLANAVIGNFQVWFVPKLADPRFSGYDEFMFSYAGKQITANTQGPRNPPSFFHVIAGGAALNNARNSDHYKTLGIHIPASNAGLKLNAELFDAYSIIWNFRARAWSNRIARRKYFSEDTVSSTKFDRAFWPVNRFSMVVPDYERALVVGALNLDVSAGQLPVSGITRIGTGNAGGNVTDLQHVAPNKTRIGNTDNQMVFDITSAASNIYADMVGTDVITSLADIDTARVRQSMAKLRAAYAGNDWSGFENEDVLIGEMMRGLHVPATMLDRPILLDSVQQAFGLVERFSTDAAALDVSTTRGRFSASLKINLPQQDVGGLILVVGEVLPERIYERQEDPHVFISDVSDLPDALRDIQRVEPVDIVKNRRLDMAHSAPDGGYGFEPMNAVWQRSYTRLGGVFYKPSPSSAWSESRAAIWAPEIVDPVFSADHYLAPANFPHTVFADTAGPAFELVARHAVNISGLTQFGDVLAENNDDYSKLEAL